MRSLSALLHHLASRWTILLVTFIYAWFIATVMPAQSIESWEYAGQWGAPDRHLFYTPDELYAELRWWGAAGRQHYIDFRLGLDIVWALAYSLFLILVTSVALQVAVPANDWRRKLNLLGVIPLLSDLTENALGIWLVGDWPARHDWAVWFASSVTAIKWLSLGLAHVVMVVALVAAAKVRFRP
jgi:hypothetical protein